MSNTGRKIVLTLKQVDQVTGIPTGNVKSNDSLDPDFIASYTDLVACPISYATTCPIVIATVLTDQIAFEFGVPTNVLSNPAISSVEVSIRDAGTNSVQTFTFPLPRIGSYFSGRSVSLSSGTYTIWIRYLAPDSSVVNACVNLATLIIS